MIAKLLGKRVFSTKKPEWHHTTILALKRNGETIIAGDGQVSQGSVRIKTKAVKIKEVGTKVYAGFAGSLADALTLV